MKVARQVASDMWPYWLLFLGVAWMSVSSLRPRAAGCQLLPWSLSWKLAFVALVLMIGLRHEVGGDWGSYLRYVDTAAGQDLLQAVLAKGDAAYGLLNWIAVRLGGSVYLVNLVCAVLFSWGLLRFCRAQPRPWLALTVAVPYLVVVVAMGYSRQGVAIGLAMIGLISLAEGKRMQFILWIAFAATFHKSAVVLIPLGVLLSSQRPILTVVGVAVSGAVMFALFLQETSDALVINYIDAEMESSGAFIRVIMNAVPGLLFLIFRRRFNLGATQRAFWSWMALVALGFVPLLLISPSSTAVDRLALYWIPLQLFVWSRLPDVLGKPGEWNAVWVCFAIFYSAAVLFVWLVFATHSMYWLPYQFYPWVAIWA